MEERDKFWHLCHLHALRHESTKTATNAKTEDQQAPARPVGGRTDDDGCQHGKRHTNHAEEVTLARGCGVRKTTQGKNKQHAGNEVKNGR